MTTTEEQRNADEAAEIVVLCRDMAGAPSFIGILDDARQQPMYELNKSIARAMAHRLLQLADELSEPPRTLRRASDVDEQLMERER